MADNPAYLDTYDVYQNSENNRTSREKPDRTYTYDEAINLAGNGRYNIGLLATLSVGIIAMGLDMFGFSVVVTGCSCDFQLNMGQKSILLSMPFIGPIIMAYPWGFISDTQGRKKSLLIALWVSFLLSTISAFSPNWIMLAVLRLISTSFCSCVQSAAYALLGESCVENVRGPYMLIMTSILNFDLALYMMIAFGILNLQFSIDLGLITFLPWRLLTLVLALPLGISAFCLHYFYESPKFLINAGREAEAVACIRNIWKRNGRGDLEDYPVNKIILNEEGNVERQDQPLLVSLWHQTAPLFKPPLLLRSLQLFYMTAVIYSISNTFFIWFPLLAELFANGLTSSDADRDQGLCHMIVQAEEYEIAYENMACITKVDTCTTVSAIIEGIAFVSVNLAIAKLASRKKLMTIVIMLISSVTGAGAVIVSDNMVSFVLFFGLLFNGLCIGIISSYFVDLYPTSYRGMAACLGVMVARISALGGVNLLATFMMSHCHVSFYTCSVLLLSGVVVSCFLPPDRPNKGFK